MPPETDPFGRALSGIIPPIALLAALSIALFPFRDDLGSGTIALVLLLPPLLATIGGLRVALGMAALCALTFNLVFTQPYGSLRIESSESVAAFFIYLLVAFVVALFSSRLRDTERAANRRAVEAGFLHSATVDLLTADDPPAALRRALASLRATLGLAAVRLHAEAVGMGVVDESAGAMPDGGPAVSFPLLGGGSALGVLEIAPGRDGLTDDERQLLQDFADLTAIALGRTLTRTA